MAGSDHGGWGLKGQKRAGLIALLQQAGQLDPGHLEHDTNGELMISTLVRCKRKGSMSHERQQALLKNIADTSLSWCAHRLLYLACYVQDQHRNMQSRLSTATDHVELWGSHKAHRAGQVFDE